VDIIKIINDSELGEIVFQKNTRAKNYIFRIKDGRLFVTIPKYGIFAKANEFLLVNKHKFLKKIQMQPTHHITDVDDIALRKKALSVLPAQLARLASMHNFVYLSVKIRKSRTRWGSCSSKKTISLSLYLMILPEHLIEYVLLHELCHTVHMNHSAAFWNLLNKFTDNKARELRKELRAYRFEKLAL